MSLSLFLYLVAVILIGLSAFGINPPRVSLAWLGMAIAVVHLRRPAGDRVGGDMPEIPLLSEHGVTQVPVSEGLLAKIRELGESMRQAEERGAWRVTWIAGVDASGTEDL